MLEPGMKVKLIAFNNSTTAPDDCDPCENYWSLIGELGTIVKPINSRSRVLVQFDVSVNSMGLHCHNAINNSLLILGSDLEVLNAKCN